MAGKMAFATIFFIFSFWIHCHADVLLVGADGSRARIDVPQSMTTAEAQAVEDMSRTLDAMALRESNGRSRPAQDSRPIGCIMVERTGEIPISLRDADSFSIVADHNTLRLRAKTPQGITQGIYWFLRVHGGVRWYTPEANATFIPEKKPWVLPDFSATPEPAFASRVLYGLGNKDGALWGRRNGLGNSFAFSHNLARVITPALLQDHPNWRCIFSGRTPPPAQARFYHPQLQTDGIAQQAAKRANAFFEGNPAAFSFSLGLEDNTRFSQSKEALNARGPLRFYRGLPDYSDMVFQFMNAASKALSERAHDNRFLGCLAYQWNTNAPSFRLRCDIAPFVASDRSFWHVDDFRHEEKELLRHWSQSGVDFFGLYDYIYGNPFLIPRPLERLPQWLKTAHTLGARAYFAEAQPVQEYDFKKLWVLASLLWNIDQDPQSLSQEWLNANYAQAAPFVTEFFGLWENVWTAQRQNIYWLRNYWDEAQGLLASPEQLKRMVALLEKAAESVPENSSAARRIEALRMRWKLSEAFCDMIRLKAKLFAAAPLRETAKTNALYRDLWAYLAARARFKAELSLAPEEQRAAAIQTDRSDPLVGAYILLLQRARSQGRMISFVKSSRALAEHPGATEAFRETVAAASRMRANAVGQNTYLLKNAAFCETREMTPADFNPLWPEYAGAIPADWQLRALRNESLLLTLEKGTSKSGTSWVVGGAENAHLFQWVQLPERTTVFFAVNVQGRLREGAQAFLILTWIDADGLRRSREARLFPGEYQSPRTLWMAAPMFDKTTRCALGLIVSHQPAGDILRISRPQAVVSLVKEPSPNAASFKWRKP